MKAVIIEVYEFELPMCSSGLSKRCYRYRKADIYFEDEEE